MPGSTRLRRASFCAQWGAEVIAVKATPSDRGMPGNTPADVESPGTEHRPMITDPPLISRRAVIGGGLVGMGGLLLFPSQLLARSPVPGDSFVVLLKGVYQPVVRGPNLGLSTVDLSDGSYSTTSIYPVSGTPGNQNQGKRVGTFYVQFEGDLCAYHIPGGSFAMQFTGSDFGFVDDGAGGQFLVGTFELTVIEGTGVYRRFVGGHNHMVDRLHFLASGAVDEFCFCFISQP
jgi:hypothetical protein